MRDETIFDKKQVKEKCSEINIYGNPICKLNKVQYIYT